MSTRPWDGLSGARLCAAAGRTACSVFCAALLCGELNAEPPDPPFPTPQMTQLPGGPPPFEYVDVGEKIPNYPPSNKWGVEARPLHMMQRPLTPQESMKRMVVPEGFHVELFAAEPDLGGKPLCMAWDERGRLWVCESLDYPNELHPRNEGRDRIRICEDTDGDGRADKFTVFAEHLSIPTSLAFARGGVIVHNGTQTLLLKDTNGDDRADERRVLLSTWALGDTHGGPSNMLYGLDNWIWGMQGYNKSTIKIGEKRRQFAQGFHRFRADGSAIEFIRSTNNNTWGIGMSEEGIVFGSTANRCPSVYMPIPNRYYERVRGWTPRLTLESIADSNRIRPITDKVRQMDHHGGFTAATGHALYTARAYPQEYWNRTAFVCEPTGHVVTIFVLSADGAGFRSTSPANLLASDDEWTAPTMAEIGPDGCVWVIDWYNFIVQHNPTPAGFQTGKGAAYETDLRDKKHGRIYRIVCDSAPATARLDLSKAPPDQLVATLAHDNLFWRRHAQRLLVERGKLDIVPQLLKLATDTNVDALGLNVGAIHALWTLNGLGALDGKHADATAAAVAALHHPSPGVRRNAVQVLPVEDESSEAILEAGLLEDPNAQVRLTSLLALADLPPSAATGRAVAKLLARSESTGDRWLADAATCAAAASGIDFLAAAVDATQPSSQLAAACEIVANHIARSDPGPAVESVLASLAVAKPAVAGAIVRGLDAGWPARVKLPVSGASRDALKQLLPRLPFEVQVRLARLATRGGDPEMQQVLSQLTEGLFTELSDGKLPAKDRAATAELIVASQPGDVEVANKLLALITPQASPDLGLAILRALRKCDAPALGTAVLERLPALTPSTRDEALELLLSRPSLATHFLSAIESGDIKLSELSLAQKQRLSTYPDRKLRERAKVLLAKGQENIGSDRKQVLGEFADLVQARGDAASGKSVFTKTCAVCHQYQGEGAAVGPDLTGMAIHGKQQLLVHILDPSRDVEGNYQAYTIVLADGRVASGMLAGESATSVEFIDGEGKRSAILREDIEEISRTGKSLMPEGFEKQLTRGELSDILEFLTQPTRFVPLDLRRAATVSSYRGMFISADSDVECFVFDDWGPKSAAGVPFYPVDPQRGHIKNAIMLHGELGTFPPQMPKSVTLGCGLAARAIHILGGVSGWGFPATPKGGVSMIVRLHYADGESEDHLLINGVHLADYLGHPDVPGSQKAFSLGRQQLRYLKIEPRRAEAIETVELVKGTDRTAPVVMGVTVERR